MIQIIRLICIATATLPAICFIVSQTPVESGAFADRVKTEHSVEEILSKVRKAVRYDSFASQKNGFLFTGDSVNHGAKGTFHIHASADGKFDQLTAGPLGEFVEFDGDSGWTTDWSGMPRDLQMRELHSQQLMTWFHTGSWLAKNISLEFTFDKSKSDGNSIVLKVKHKQGPLKGIVEIDRKTWLPRKLKLLSAGIEQVVFVEDYRESFGFRYPALTKITTGKHTASILQIHKVIKADAAVKKTKRPHSFPKDTKFDPKTNPTVKLTRTRTGHLLIEPMINGKYRGKFILDTGAGGPTVIDQKLSKDINAEKLGETVIGSLYGPFDSSILQIASVQVGPMIIQNPKAITMDLQFLTNAFGVKIAGIVGYDLFSRCVADFELANNTVRIHDPKKFNLGAGEWKNMLINNRTPNVKVSYEGKHAGYFLLDTGANGTVMFHTPAVKKYDLTKKKTSDIFQVQSGKAVSARLDSFRLAGHELGPVNVRLAVESTGLLADGYRDGMIGFPLLSRFRLVLDYQNRRFALIEKP